VAITTRLQHLAVVGQKVCSHNLGQGYAPSIPPPSATKSPGSTCQNSVSLRLAYGRE